MLKQEVADKLTELITPMAGKRILEIGTGWAESTEFFSRLKPDWKIYTIDGFGLYGDGRIYAEFDHEKVLKINQKIRRCENVIQILGDSSLIPWELPIDVLFLDGDHSYDGCLRDFISFNSFVRRGGIIVFDDYTQENNPANGVRLVVEHILSSKNTKYKIIHKGYYSAILERL